MTFRYQNHLHFSLENNDLNVWTLASWYFYTFLLRRSNWHQKDQTSDLSWERKRGGNIIWQPFVVKSLPLNGCRFGEKTKCTHISAFEEFISLSISNILFIKDLTRLSGPKRLSKDSIWYLYEGNQESDTLELSGPLRTSQDLSGPKDVYC